MSRQGIGAAVRAYFVNMPKIFAAASTCCLVDAHSRMFDDSHIAPSRGAAVQRCVSFTLDAYRNIIAESGLHTFSLPLIVRSHIAISGLVRDSLFPHGSPPKRGKSSTHLRKSATSRLP